MPKSLPEATPERIKKMREKVNLTQAQAAELIHASDKMRWSDFERGKTRMPTPAWELFLIKTGQREVVITVGEG